MIASGIPDWYTYLRSAKALGVSPFDLDERAGLARQHPAWRYWATVAEAVEPPPLMRVAGLV